MWSFSTDLAIMPCDLQVHSVIFLLCTFLIYLDYIFSIFPYIVSIETPALNCECIDLQVRCSTRTTLCEWMNHCCVNPEIEPNLLCINTGLFMVQKTMCISHHLLLLLFWQLYCIQMFFSHLTSECWSWCQYVWSWSKLLMKYISLKWGYK